MKNNIVPALDARQYIFTRLYRETKNSVFDIFVAAPLEDRPSIVRSVSFNNLEETEFDKNNVSFDYYGTGTIYSYEAVELNNGKYLFCIIDGVSFAGTFSPDDRISMQYYEVTKI